MLSYLLLALLLGGCTFLDQLKSTSSNGGQQSFFGKMFGGGHSGDSSSEAFEVGADIKRSKTPFRGAGPNQALAVFPHNRCKTGYLTFGPLNGEYFKCEALGRGATRWTENNPASYPSNVADPVTGAQANTVGYKSSVRRTKTEDWSQGRTSNGRQCWVYDSKFTAGKTPVADYTVGYISGSKPDWGSRDGVYMDPPSWLKKSRDAIFTHSDNRFGGSGSVLDEPTHSTVGCIRLRPACQDLFNQWARQNQGRPYLVREE